MRTRSRPVLLLTTVSAALALPALGFVVTAVTAASKASVPAAARHPEVSATPVPTSPPVPTGVQPNITAAPLMNAAHPLLSPTPSSPPSAPSMSPPPITPLNVTTSGRTPSPGPEPTALVVDAPVDAWEAPDLSVGLIPLPQPRTASGAKTRVRTTCEPAWSCTRSPAGLFISPDTLTATVTWTSPQAPGFTPWQETRTYARPFGGSA